MFSYGETFRLICSLFVFYLGIQYGRNNVPTTENCVPSQKLVVVKPPPPVHTSATDIVVPDCPPTPNTIDESKKGKYSTDICPRLDDVNEAKYTLRLAKATAPVDLFPHLHHAGSPAKWSFYLSEVKKWETDEILDAPCKEVYLTRTGSRAGQPNKCVAVTFIPEGYESTVQQSHRYGITAGTLDQYQKDYPRNYGLKYDTEEKDLAYPFLQNYDKLVQEFLRKMGNPIDELGRRRQAIVMVANKGVMDLLLNFLCSAEEIHLDLKSVIVFVGDEAYIQLIENMGANAIYSEALGSMPVRPSYVMSLMSSMVITPVTPIASPNTHLYRPMPLTNTWTRPLDA